MCYLLSDIDGMAVWKCRRVTVGKFRNNWPGHMSYSYMLQHITLGNKSQQLSKIKYYILHKFNVVCNHIMLLICLLGIT